METISNNPNAVTPEQYGVLEKKLFKFQSLQETRESLSKIFLDVMCSEFADDSQYRSEIVQTIETLNIVLTTIEQKHDPYDNLRLTITIISP
jgi:hypothetical protein